MSETCYHTQTNSDNHCVKCGIQIMEVHDRPCCECVHSRELFDGWVCSKKLMAISSKMHVSYFLVPGPGREGLCFEEKIEASA